VVLIEKNENLDFSQVGSIEHFKKH